jgi:hypothetical protein
MSAPKKEFVRFETTYRGKRYQCTVRIDYDALAASMLRRANSNAVGKSKLAHGAVTLVREFELDSDNAAVEFTRLGTPQ